MAYEDMPRFCPIAPLGDGDMSDIVALLRFAPDTLLLSCVFTFTNGRHIAKTGQQHICTASTGTTPEQPVLP